ncbi:rCG45577 [Rattus norvegicus]|uniref:RCG45577 n=1 Tax=Rattus norvegicus TaxID=10116 RepID=A6JTF7_RAT|nr:rCG45577 [Rattus norvegicus]
MLGFRYKMTSVDVPFPTNTLIWDSGMGLWLKSEISWVKKIHLQSLDEGCCLLFFSTSEG